MNLPSYIHRLFAHVAWADDAVLESLQRVPDASDKAIELFAHVLGAEHVWLARLQETPAAVAVWPRLSVLECAELAGKNRESYSAFLDSLNASDLERTVHYRNSAGAEFDSRVDDILIHVALHGAYHRGQVARGLREGGSVPAPTDYIAFVRGVAAAVRSGDR
ncbi:MAG: DinB family protein [Gemmatimonadaceae bacterium]